MFGITLEEKGWTRVGQHDDRWCLPALGGEIAITLFEADGYSDRGCILVEWSSGEGPYCSVACGRAQGGYPSVIIEGEPETANSFVRHLNTVLNKQSGGGGPIQFSEENALKIAGALSIYDHNSETARDF